MSAPGSIIYVAGPFRAATPWGVERNIRAAEEAGYQIALRGHTPLIPHTMYRFFDKSLPDIVWLDMTMQLLQRCDGLYLLPRWGESSGSRREEQEAARLKLAIYHDLESIAPLR